MNSHLLTAEEYITQFKHESEDLIALLDGLSSFALQAAENDITETYAGSRPGETIRILTKCVVRVPHRK